MTAFLTERHSFFHVFYNIDSKNMYKSKIKFSYSEFRNSIQDFRVKSSRE